MKKKVKLRGYFSGNLGDDLLVEIISSRYTNTLFYICGPKIYKNLYTLYPNVLYKPYDGMLLRVFLAIRRYWEKTYQKRILKRVDYQQESTDAVIDEYWSKRANVNVIITGSGFVNSADEGISAISRKMATESVYFNRHPFILGCNFGPYTYIEYLEMYQKLFTNANDICFRDKHSASLFPNANNVRYEADIVFGYPFSKIHQTPTSFEKSTAYWLISIANIKKDNDMASAYYDDYVNMISRIVSERAANKLYTLLVGFSINQEDDKTIQEILEHVNCAHYVHHLCYPLDSAESVLGYFSHAEAIVATRYHAMVLGFLFQKKTCTISYNEKAAHSLDLIDPLCPYIKLEELNTVRRQKDLEEKMYEISQERLDFLCKSADRQFWALDQVLE